MFGGNHLWRIDCIAAPDTLLPRRLPPVTSTHAAMPRRMRQLAMFSHLRPSRSRFLPFGHGGILWRDRNYVCLRAIPGMRRQRDDATGARFRSPSARRACLWHYRAKTARLGQPREGHQQASAIKLNSKLIKANLTVCERFTSLHFNSASCQNQ
jgi:hypothetical protein